MMERYLFRAKSCMGWWVYGHLKKQLVGGEPEVWAIQSFNDCQIKNQSVYSGLMKLYENVVDPATIGQCTGLRDKNGVLIFEGDVLRWNSSDPQYAELEDDSPCEVKWYQSGWHIDTGVVTVVMGCEIRDLDKLIEWEIIGNIHDNPEFLKGPNP